MPRIEKQQSKIQPLSKKPTHPEAMVGMSPHDAATIAVLDCRIKERQGCRGQPIVTQSNTLPQDIARHILSFLAPKPKPKTLPFLRNFFSNQCKRIESRPSINHTLKIGTPFSLKEFNKYFGIHQVDSTILLIEDVKSANLTNTAYSNKQLVGLLVALGATALITASLGFTFNAIPLAIAGITLSLFFLAIAIALVSRPTGLPSMSLFSTQKPKEALLQEENLNDFSANCLEV